MFKKYSPKKTEVKEITQNNSEIKLNLRLQGMKDNKILICGYVVNKTSKEPIPNACIKITDGNYNPIEHGYTDKYGKFNLYISKRDCIIINCAKQGFITFTSQVYNCCDKNLKNVLIELESIPNNQNMLTGHLLSLNKDPIENLEIMLQNICNQNLNYNTYTVSGGFFLFNDILPGNYVLTSLSNSYEIESVTLCVKPSDFFIDVGEIYAKHNIISGTVNGIIQDINGNPIKNAVVVLYDADKNNPVQITYTNELGVYLFGNLPPGRYYIISQK